MVAPVQLGFGEVESDIYAVICTAVAGHGKSHTVEIGNKVTNTKTHANKHTNEETKRQANKKQTKKLKKQTT